MATVEYHSMEQPGPEVGMRVRLLCIGWVAWLLVNPAWSADRALSVTIYNDNLALIQDRRDIEIKDGRQRIEFQHDWFDADKMDAVPEKA